MRIVPLLPSFLLVACSVAGATPPPGDPPEGAGEPAPVEPQTLVRPAMHQYFWSTTDGRDLVVAGELEAARSAFVRLLEEPVPEDVGPEWVAGIESVRRIATAASEAETLPELARHVGEASRLCGDCHAAAAGGPGVTFAEPPDLDDSLEGEMHRHVWAAERLWEGLVVPSDERWRAGVVAVFADPAMSGDVGDWALEGNIDALAEARPEERTAFYGDFIAACASCHQAMDRGPDGR